MTTAGRAMVYTSGVLIGHIPFIPGPPTTGTTALALMRDGQMVAHVTWASAKFV